MEQGKKLVAILNLSGELIPEFRDYFASRKIPVVDPLATTEKRQWTHIIVKDLTDFAAIAKTYDVARNGIHLISLSPVRDVQSFAVHNGNLVLDDYWFKGVMGAFILDKYFQGYGGVSLGESYPAFLESGSFKVTNPFNTGEYLDRMTQAAFEQESDALSIKTFFDHLIMYTTGLKNKNKAGLPFEVTYGSYQDIFAVQIHFFSMGMSLSDVASGLRPELSRKAEEFYLAVALQSADFFDFSFLPEVNKVVVTGLWAKAHHSRLDNRGFMFAALPGIPAPVSKKEDSSSSALIELGKELQDFSTAIKIPELVTESRLLKKGPEFQEEKHKRTTQGVEASEALERLKKSAPEQTEVTLVKGTKDAPEDVSFIKGSKDPREEVTLVKGAKSALEEVNLVKGTKATPEEMNIIRGTKEAPEEMNIIRGTKEAPEKMNIIRGSKEAPEEMNIIRGSKEAPEEMNIIRGTKEAPEEMNIIRGSKEAPEEMNIIRGTKASPDEMKLVPGMRATRDEAQVSTIVSGKSDDNKSVTKVSGAQAPTGASAAPESALYQSEAANARVIKEISDASRELEMKLLTATAENEGLRIQIKSLTSEVRILKESRLALAEMHQQATEDNKELKLGELEADQSLKRQFLAKLSQQKTLNESDLKKLVAIIEREARIVTELREQEAKTRKVELEISQKETFFDQELDKVERQLQGKELVLSKTKDNLTKLIQKKDQQLLELRGKVDQLTRDLSASPDSVAIQRVKELERQNQGLLRQIEHHKQKISTMAATHIETNKSDDSFKDEARRLQMMNQQLKNQYDMGRKEIEKLQNKVSMDNSQILRLTQEKANLEQLLKRATLQAKERSTAPAPSQSEAELKRLQSQNHILEAQLKEAAARMTNLEIKLAESQKPQKSGGIMDEASKVKITQLENSLKKLTQDLLQTKALVVEEKKETNKLRHERNSLQNQVEKFKKDTDKTKPASPKKPGGKAA